jgi:serine/threonine protein kinase
VENLTGIDEFEKLTHLGTGNFSTIFKGKSKKDGKIYAIKQAEKSKLQRLRKEADLFMEKHCLSKLKGITEFILRLRVRCETKANLPRRNSSLSADGMSLQWRAMGQV